MDHEIVNEETPEMKELISGIKEVSKRIREIAQTHRQLFGGEIYLTGREACEHLFVSPRPCKTIGAKALFPTPKSQGKSSIASQTSTDYCKRIIRNKTFAKGIPLPLDEYHQACSLTCHGKLIGFAGLLINFPRISSSLFAINQLLLRYHNK